MGKYWQIIKNTWAEYSVYRLNFLVWRLRSFISFITIYFFWWALFSSTSAGGQFFGWQKNEILTYILGVAIVKSVILSSRTIDVGGEIDQGNLTNYLLKPLDFFKFWFSRDIADKILNIFFSLLEIIIFASFIKPEVFIQTNPLVFFGLFISLIFAAILYFYINFFLGIIAFWTPESWSGAWGPRFVFTIILDFFAGTIFPLDLLPKTVFNLIQLTPFPYLIYFPLRIYLGKADPGQIGQGFIICLFWLAVWYFIVKKTWNAGIRLYGAEGR